MELKELEGIRELREMEPHPAKPEVNNLLNPKQQEDLKGLIIEFQDVFNEQPREAPGVKHCIETCIETLHCRTYHMQPMEKVTPTSVAHSQTRN